MNKFTINEIIQAVNEISPLKKKRVHKKYNFNRPLILNNIIKYEPKNNRYLFLKNIINSNIKLIIMKNPRINNDN